jgi:TolB-like protein/cytochrome c-type biogenesis protein CcmH/NrfG
MGEIREISGKASELSGGGEGVVAFGSVRFAIRTGELRLGGLAAKLTPRAAAVLELLVEQAPQLVTKEEFVARVWDGKAVGDEALTSCIQELRRALNDDARQPRYIETRHRRGYRLLTPVAGRAAAPATAMAEPAPPPLPEKPSIAVLPFRNMSGDPGQEYFTDGISIDIITELTRFRSLFVIARNSSFSYKGTTPDVRQVGKELGVRYVLEGSIRKSSDRVRVTGQLIDSLTGSTVWAERYDRELKDIFAVQEEVTRAIVVAIAPRVDAIEQSRAARRRPGNFSAYEMTLRAWAHGWEGQEKADRSLLELSIQEAKQALAIDPDCVRAWQILAGIHNVCLNLRMTDDRDHSFREAMSAATRAIELDGADPLGYAIRGSVVASSEGLDRYPDALADARRAYEMNPNDDVVLRTLANYEIVTGEPQRAIERLHRITRLNPRDSHAHMTYNSLAFASFAAKQYAEGVHWASRALNEMPSLAYAYHSLAVCLVGLGEIDKAKAAFATGQKLAPEYFRIKAEGGSSLARAEDRKRSVTFLRVAAGLEDPGAADAVR